MDRRKSRGWNRLGAIALLFLLLPGIGVAQVDGPHLTLGPYVGYAGWSDDVNLDDDWQFGGRLGLWLNGYLGLEGHYGILSGETIDGGRPWGSPGDAIDQDMSFYGVNAIFNITPTKSVSPFLLGGWQEARFDENDVWPDPSYLNGPQLGAGVFFWPLSRLAVRAEVRDWMWNFDDNTPEPPGDEWTHNLVYSIGVDFALGGWPTRRDTDQDGVLDRKDQCPKTPLGARVDSQGCPIDSDADGVFDGLDACPGTPEGADVDANGCPRDTDGDSVFDGVDRCPATPRGAVVDAKGCPVDSDGDGIFDGLDKCPNTQAGATVDSYGCPADSDHDGVLDGLDKCPNTPATARVDIDGCPIMISEKEVELLDTGKITVRNINFDTGKWDIRPESLPVLDEIGAILIQWPDLRVEIGGHTDSRGSDKMNQELSDKRANAVREHLLAKFPQLQGSQYTAVGYGEKQPVADNNSDTGMAKNRRVEFKVLNTEVLKKERERRQMLEK